jgi:hypothetical protein
MMYAICMLKWRSVILRTFELFRIAMEGTNDSAAAVKLFRPCCFLAGERKMMSNVIVESEIDVPELWTILKYSIR